MDDIYQVMAESTQSYIFVINQEGQIEYVNPSAAGVWNMTPDQLIGKRAEDLFGKEDFQTQWGHITSAFHTGRPSMSETTLRFGDRELWLHTEWLPIKTDLGSVRAVAGISRDITANKGTEEAQKQGTALEELILEISNRFLSFSEDQIDEGIEEALEQIGHFSGVDHAFCILISSDLAAATITHEWCGPGVTSQKEIGPVLKEEFAWMSTQILNGKVARINRREDLPPEARQERAYMEAQGVRSVLNVPFNERGGIIKGAFGIETHSHERTWREEDIRLLKMFGNVVTTALENKQATKTLREREENFRDLAENANDGIAIIWGKGVFTYINRRGAEIFGYTVEELLNSATAAIVFHPDHHKMITERYWKIMAGEPVVRTYEPRCVRKDGSEVWLEVSSARMIWQGQVADMVILRDITDRKKAEQQIREYREHLEELVVERTAHIRDLERQQAQTEKLAAVGRLAARVAHEINNPLAGLKNSFLLVKEAVSENHPYYSYVGRIEKEIDRIARIVRQMFDLYRPEQDSPQEFSVGEIIEDITFLLHPLCREHKVALETDTRQAPGKVCLPEDLLRQILFNLIINAVEASPEGKAVRIAAAVAPTALTITVTDQGKGIPEGIRLKILEPFFTTKSGTEARGLGLGLSMSKGLVETMKGTLDFETRIGEGTTFQVTIPLGSDMSKAESATSGAGHIL
jgi:two-component system, sporulation sensor kinase C